MRKNNGGQPSSADRFIKKHRNIQHIFISNSYYFITITTFQKQKLSNTEKDFIFKTILNLNNNKYNLHACVIMPDHIHMIINPKESLPAIMHSIKSYCVHMINKQSNRTGRLWQKSYFEKIIRGERDFNGKIAYIANNPVKIFLVQKFEDYKWLYIRYFMEHEEYNETN